MILRWPERKQIILCLFLAALFACAPARTAPAEEWRWAGSGVSGGVEVRQFGATRMAAVDQIARGLGYSVSVEKNELVVPAAYGLRFVPGAAAVWLGYSVIALPSRTRVENGHWWVGTDSALKVFSQFLRRNGRDFDLRWDDAADERPESPPPSEVPPREQDEYRTPPQLHAAGTSLPRLRSLRWGGDEQTVRAVLDLDGDDTPTYTSDGRRTVVRVDRIDPSLVPGIEGRGDIGVIVKNGDPATVEFSFPRRTVKIFSLDEPRRLVLDFSRSAEARPEAVAVPPAQPPRETPENKPSPRARRQRPSKKQRGLVVIDAGHGGRDPGAVAHGYREKNIALQIAARVSKALSKRGVDVKMTRTGDTYPTLKERTEMANSWKADVFISIHLNALPKGQHSRGVEIYIMALPSDKDAMTLAKIENAEIAEGASGANSAASDRRTEMLLEILGNMQQNQKISESTVLAEDLFHSGQSGGLDMKRVAQAPFWVLRGAAMPAVLIETGFITELSEVRRLAQPAYQQRMAESFAAGIVNFIKR